MNFSNEIQETIYAEYLKIPIDYYQDKIRFFERNQSRLGVLPHEVFFMIKVDYLRSLFRVGEYDLFIQNVDTLIESLIIDNPSIPGAKTVFKDLLQKKATALHFSLSYNKAARVLKELVRIEASNYNKQLFLKNQRDALRAEGQNIRAVIIGIIILSGCIIAVELLVVRTLFPHMTGTIETIRNITFCFAVSLFLFQEITFFRKALNTLKKVLNQK